MLVLKRSSPNGKGIELKLKIEHADDIWCLYNILTKGDRIESFTSRKVKIENSAGVVVKQEIKKFNLKIEIEKITYISSYDDLEINGRNISPNEYVKIGQYHTLDIRPNSVVTISKNEWDYFCQEKLNESTNIKNHAEQAFLIMDIGSAKLYMILRYITKEVFSLTVNIPKRKAFNNKITPAEKATQSFFIKVLDKVAASINFEVAQSIIVAGPGFTRDDFIKFIVDKSLTLNHIEVHKNISKFISCASTFSDKCAINEVLSDPVLSKKIGAIHFLQHDKALESLRKRFQDNNDTVALGLEKVFEASDAGAIETLLLTNNVIREADSNKRKHIQTLVDHTKRQGGQVYFLSDCHHASEFVKHLSGVVGLLRFTLDQVE
ncbi:bifunctional eRF1 [Babesia duncani]|uniref:Protein pelota homolog n=1 Tax=Babesia duncani TaxID=323732 RepID=A0AAD9UP77_9APIC|nr:bifunctional eRF1 [Babesia duncani]